MPVVGGSLRYAVKDNGNVPKDTPAVAYPENSYFGEVLSRSERLFGTPGHSVNPACVTAFSSGVLELVLRGFGVGWLPYSMVHREVASGDLISLVNSLGKEPLKVAVFADGKVEQALDLLDLWSKHPASVE